MNRIQKEDLVTTLSEAIVGAPLVMLAAYEGSTVLETEALRNKLRENGLRLQVVKNSLMKRAIAETEVEVLSTHLSGMTGVVISNDDPIASARAFRDALDPKGAIKLKAAFFEGGVYEGIAAAAIADLPGRDELLVSLLRTLQAGPRQVLSVMQGPARDLLYLLKNYEQKLADSGTTE
jgi:large subunit ribosomal protein L10